MSCRGGPGSVLEAWSSPQSKSVTRVVPSSVAFLVKLMLYSEEPVRKRCLACAKRRGECDVNNENSETWALRSSAPETHSLLCYCPWVCFS